MFVKTTKFSPNDRIHLNIEFWYLVTADTLHAGAWHRPFRVGKGRRTSSRHGTDFCGLVMAGRLRPGTALTFAGW